MNNIMSENYLLDRNVTITGNLTINKIVFVSENISGSGIKNISELIGKDEPYEGNLTLDNLVILDKLNYVLQVNGTTTSMETLNVETLHLDEK